MRLVVLDFQLDLLQLVLQPPLLLHQLQRCLAITLLFNIFDLDLSVELLLALVFLLCFRVVCLVVARLGSLSC